METTNRPQCTCRQRIDGTTHDATLRVNLLGYWERTMCESAWSELRADTQLHGGLSDYAVWELGTGDRVTHPAGFVG